METTMKSLLVKLVAPVVLLGCTFLPIAAHADNLHSINWRLHHQHERIHAGIGDHQLNNHQRYALAGRDARILSREDRDRSRDHGHLTVGEHRRLERSLNGNSHTIYRDRHNGM